MAAAREKVLFEKDGVFIHTTVVATSDEDALVAGKALIVQKPDGLFVEWRAKEEDTKSTDADWAMVDTVGYKNDKSSPSDTVTVQQQPKSPPPTPHKYIINFDIYDLKSFKRSKPNLGWSYLIFILKCGTTYPALHFHQGGTKQFMRELEKHLIVKRSPNDSCLYLVRQHDPSALSKSFDELQLFGDQSTHVLNKFIHDPVNTTLGGFSRVTGFLMHQLMTEPQHTVDPQQVNQLLTDTSPTDQLQLSSQQDDHGFEVVTARDLPPRPPVKRAEPVSPQRWSYHMDKEGRVENLDELKHAIFRGGVEPSIRIEIWKFLLGYYKWDSTYTERTEERRKRVDDYFAMKLQWKSVTAEQETRFSVLRERKNLIDKDVTRTDRTHPFFQGENNPNLSVLYDILMTYCMYNFDLGYVQGMSDLCAPIMVVMENEVDAFWCFAGYMDIIGHNFEMDQQGMKDQLRQLNLLLQFVDPQLYNHLESHDSSNMYFCFRWLLIIFKREFSFPEIMRLWEVYWTGKPCKNFQLFLCLAILEAEKNTLIDNNFGFTEILKHINDMSGSIDLEEMLIRAEAIYRQLAACRQLPPMISDIMQVSPAPSTSSSVGSSPGKPSRPPNPPTTTTAHSTHLATTTSSTAASSSHSTSTTTSSQKKAAPPQRPAERVNPAAVQQRPTAPVVYPAQRPAPTSGSTNSSSSGHHHHHQATNSSLRQAPGRPKRVVNSGATSIMQEETVVSDDDENMFV